MKRIILLTADDMHWDFDNSGPTISTRPNKATYGRAVKVDPHPAHAHDIKLVRKLIHKVENAYKFSIKPVWHIFEQEVLERVNGWCQAEYLYDNSKGKKRIEHHIILSGKRIPIHPAMTRYLIPHEYGHAVEDNIILKELGDLGKVEEFRAEYRKMRGLKTSDAKYSSKSWATSTGEIFANDFRILMCGLEEDFWPHPGVTHPLKSKAACKYWDTIKEIAI